VSQVGNELSELLRLAFGVGTVRDRGDGVHYFEVTRPLQLVERIFPFFDRFPLRGSKRTDLMVFREITDLVLSGQHLCAQGVIAILELRKPMNRGRKRRYSEAYVLEVLRDWESSEAIRRAPSMKLDGRRYGPRLIAI
jgi:hypothetical protein